MSSSSDEQEKSTDDNFENEAHGKLEREERFEASESDAKSRTKQKEYFKILGKSNVSYDSVLGCYMLQFYTGDKPQLSTFIPLQKIKTQHSEDDNVLKYQFVGFCYALIILSISSLFAGEISLFFWGDKMLSKNCSISDLSNHCDFDILGPTFAAPAIFLFIFGAVSFVYFFMLKNSIEKNFVDINAEWTNSIERMFAADVKSKISAFRICMLTFRQFIKWRRFANFFLRLFFVTAPFVLFVGVFFAAIVGSIQFAEFLTSVMFLYGLSGLIGWFRQQRLEQTEWRDPTVQVAVMLAQMHNRLVDRTIVGK